MNDVHADVFELLPWWVNGTLEPAAAARVERHLQHCEACRCEAGAQQRLRQAMREPTSNLDHAPQASFERLWSRIEELERDVPRPAATTPVAPAPAAPELCPAVPRAPGRTLAWRLAATVVIAIGAGLLTSHWRGSESTPALYRTATSTGQVATADPPRIRAVFAASTTVDELTAITRSAGLTVVAGPTAAGVYTLGIDAHAGSPSLDVAVDRLRDDPRVRFAEPVYVSGASP